MKILVKFLAKYEERARRAQWNFRGDKVVKTFCNIMWKFGRNLKNNLCYWGNNGETICEILSIICDNFLYFEWNLKEIWI